MEHASINATAFVEATKNQVNLFIEDEQSKYVLDPKGQVRRSMDNATIKLTNDKEVHLFQLSGGNWVVARTTAKEFDLVFYHYTIDALPKEGDVLTGKFRTFIGIGGALGMAGTWSLESRVESIQKK